MRVADGLSPNKAKGEKGGPDFSTASVYAGIVADAVAAKRSDADAWERAQEWIIANAGEAGLPVHTDSQLLAGKGALQRAVVRFHEDKANREAQAFPALNMPTSTGDGAENDPAILRTALHSARAESQALRDELAIAQDTLRAMREAQASTAE
jgi:hypothetical protein